MNRIGNIHALDWAGSYPTPRHACARAMRERRPFILAMRFQPEAGDLLIFPAFAGLTYPVLRLATEEEASLWNPDPHTFPYCAVCAEPPQECFESATEGAGNRIERLLAAIARCDQEIRAAESQPAEDRAVLVAMCIEDWRAERSLIYAEWQASVGWLAP